MSVIPKHVGLKKIEEYLLILRLQILTLPLGVGVGVGVSIPFPFFFLLAPSQTGSLVAQAGL